MPESALGPVDETRLLQAARAAQLHAPRAVLAASRSAPRCSTSRAASTPAATSRTPPIRRASAPRRRRSCAMVLAGGTRCARPGRGRRRRRRWSRRAAAAARSCASSPRPTRRCWSATASACATRFTLAQLLPDSFGPENLQAMSPALLQAVAAGPRAARPARAPRIAVVLGSGWGGADRADRRTPLRIPYAELAGFPHRHAWPGTPASSGWAASARSEVAVMSGRKHAYESGDVDGHAGSRCARCTRWAARCWCRPTRPAACTPRMAPGSLMLITDHINLSQRSPLVGDERLGALRRHGRMPTTPACAPPRCAWRRDGDVALHEGVYAWNARPAVRDAGRDPHVPAARRRCGGHEHRARDHPGAPRRHARARASRCSPTWRPGLSTEALSHAHTLAQAQAGSERRRPPARRRDLGASHHEH